MESLKRDIVAHPFFQGFKPEFLDFLVECASEQSFEADEYILKEGEEADRFYLIRRGSVALGTLILGQGFTTIETVGKGEVLGWSWLIPPHHWHFYGRAVEPTQTIVLDGERLRQKCAEDHEFGYEFLRRLALVVGQRLRATRMRLG